MSLATDEQHDSRRSVLGRAFDILECFTVSEPEQTIGSLCAKTDLPPATVHRMLANLATWGAVERAARGRYRLGMRLWRLGWGVPGARTLKDIARPILVDLHAVTGEITLLASRDNDEMVVADVIAGNAQSRRQPLPRQLPIAGSAPGLVLLAHLPPEEAAELAASRGSVVDFRFWQQMAEIRRNGVAVTRGQQAGATAWAAAPVFDETGAIRSTVSVVMPTELFNPVGHNRAVSAAARAVSQGLAATLSPAS